MEDTPLINTRRPELSPLCTIQLPESPRLPMEFLSRSWSVPGLEVSKALSYIANSNNKPTSIPEDVIYREKTEDVANNTMPSYPLSFASSATSQLVLERIMSQSEVSPLTSGRLSHSSGPLNLAESDSPPISPSEDLDDIVKYLRSHKTIYPLFTGGRASAGAGSGTPAGGAKTVGRWLKDRKEKKKEESRSHNAQLHAAISVAAVAAAVAAIAAATASSSASAGNEQLAKTDMAMASAATLVAAQCVEAAEAMGAERDHLASVVSSAVNVHSHDDISTLTAAAATALRGAATLKARALKDVVNVAAVIPAEKSLGICGAMNNGLHNRSYSGELVYGEGFLGACSLEFLAKGSELLKRTRKGDLHWKIVSVYLHRTGQVMLKMKSRHVAGTITKKKKNVVLEVCKDMPAWPGRYLFEGGDEHRYFGLKTTARGIVEFECKNQREHDMWTEGVSRLLSIVAQKRNRK
ncbi:hypothetical protein K2173_025640 [Erythroxylum novogranatense]|uniref:VAN3-binding protein-like n=1 Tax=Erythroxylum novogranatense TaxID=1862640 RepID=A0AAV8SBU5_9ROSI|nr:hypothetical protein K2173_025640 [Erythroxylum novogranatense]